MVVFRSAFHGFNKNDVNTYIYNENKKFSDTLEDYKNDIENLKNSGEELRKTISKKDEEIVLLKNKYEALLNESEEKLLSKEKLYNSIKSECDELRSQIKSLNETPKNNNEASSGQFIKITKIIDEQNLEIESLKKELDKYRHNNTSELFNNQNINAYDFYTVNGNETNEKADSIMAEAELRAYHIIKTAKSEAEQIKKDFLKDHLTLVDSISSEIHKAAQTCINETNLCLSKLKSSSTAMIEDIESTKKEMNGKINYFCASMKEAVNIKLKNFDVQHGVTPVNNLPYQEDRNCERTIGCNRKQN